MLLRDFLKTLIFRLEDDGIPYCLLRNYETLPEELASGDIDFLISPKSIYELENIIFELFASQLIKVVRRSYVYSFFLYDIERGGSLKGLQVDFAFKYLYKGTSYVDVDQILECYCQEQDFFRVPFSNVQAILILLPYFLSYGDLPSKYKNYILDSIKCNEANLKVFLEEQINHQLPIFLDSVSNNNLVDLRVWRQVFQRSITQKGSISQKFTHYIGEIALRLPLQNILWITVELNSQYIEQLKALSKNVFKKIIFVRKYSWASLRIFSSYKNFVILVLYQDDSSKSFEDSLSAIDNALVSKGV